MGSAAKLEQAGKLEHPLSSKTEGEQRFFMIWLRVLFVPDKASLKINAADDHPGQPLGVFQLSHLFQITRTSYTTSFFLSSM
jgi:hypothetical protein